jgi:transposase InsO family protein
LIIFLQIVVHFWSEIWCTFRLKFAAFWKIIKNEFFYPNSFDSLKDLIYNLGNFLFEYNHLRRHGGIDYQTPYEKLEKVTELLS